MHMDPSKRALNDPGSFTGCGIDRPKAIAAISLVISDVAPNHTRS